MSCTAIKRDGDTVILEIQGVTPVAHEGVPLEPVPVILHLGLQEAVFVASGLFKAVYGEGDLQFVRME